MVDLGGLTQKRGNLKGILTNIRKWVDKIDQTFFVEQMEARLEKLDKIWDDFNQVNDEISINGGESDADAFHDKFFETKALLARYIRSRNEPATGSTNDQTLRLNSSIDQLVQQQRSFFDGFTDFSRAQTVDLRPPRITIEPFNGNYDSWMTFRDLYLSSIHNNDKLSNVQKFKCLMSFLKGPAHQLLVNIPVTDANYPSAWETLCERYSKPKILIQALINQFMNQGTISKGSKMLRELTEAADEVIRGLKSIGKDAETRDVWLIYLLVEKLDTETRMYWAEESNDDDYPTFNNFLKFLGKRCNILEACQPIHTESQKFAKPAPLNNKRQSTSSHASSLAISCPMCKSRHFLHRCFRFQALDHKGRMEFIASHSVCINCLRSDHNEKECTSTYKCSICAQPHHTLLHNHTSTPLNTTAANIAINDISIESNHALVMNTTKPNSYSHLTNTTKQCSQNLFSNTKNQMHTLLPTALIYIKDATGKLQVARALLDSGSQSTFISENCVQRLRLSRTRSCISVNGLARAKAGTTKGAVQLQLVSRYNAENTISVSALILNRLTSNVPLREVEIRKWAYIQGLQLSDPQFNHPSQIELIIGADVFFKTLCSDRIISDNHPIAQLTIFGWILCGQFYQKQNDNESEVNSNLLLCHHTYLHTTHEKSRQSEDTNSFPQLPLEDERCETIFSENHSRDPAGRYLLRLPVRNTPALGNSFNAALARFFSMERKFQRDESVKTAYSDFTAEYLRFCHMERVPASEINFQWKFKHYLSHHSDIKRSSTPIKLCVAFNGSTNTRSGQPLNDNRLTGPKLQQNFENKLWWQGPHWLQLHRNNWSSLSTHDGQLSESEVLCDLEKYNRTTIDIFHRQLNFDFIHELFIKFSSFAKINRIVSYTFRYHYKLKWAQNSTVREVKAVQSGHSLKKASTKNASRSLTPHLNEFYKPLENQNHINTISLFLTQNKINHKFNPASAPHFGGLWEANIKSTKHHLHRVAGSTTLTFEEMSTLLAQIEAVLNSRPLCPLSEDATVYDPLTPGHFLIGAPLTSIPEPELTHLPESRLSRWQNIQQRVQGFWKTWSMDYLTSLQRRHKWANVEAQPLINQLVVIKEDNLLPSKWAMGRVTHLHVGRDGLTRVVTLKTLKGELRRPITKICPLPVE